MLNIEFLYYDKTSCDRCASTDKAVKLSLKELKNAVSSSGFEIDIKEKKLPESKIHLSPSININGKDIENIINKGTKLKSNECTDCCKLAGHQVNCRTFTYKKKSYNHIPKEMILEAIRISLKKKR